MEPTTYIAIGAAVTAVIPVLKIIAKKTKTVKDDRIVTLLAQVASALFGRKTE